MAVRPSYTPSLLAAVCFALLCTGPQGRIRAQLAASPRALDFGEHGHLARVTRDLVLENRGGSPAKVAKLSPSCSCIKLEPPVLVQPIAPGGSVKIKVTMNGGRAMGNLEKYIAISTANPPQTLRVPVGMRVLHRFQMAPRELRFDGVVGGEPLSAELVMKWKRPLSATRDFDLRVVGVRDRAQKGPILSRHFKTELVKAEGGKGIRVTLLPTHPEGRIFADLLATVNGLDVVVPVAGNMFRSIKLTPQYFNFNRIEAASPETHAESSLLTAVDERGFSIERLESAFQARPSDDIEIVVEKEEIRERREWKVQARLRSRTGASLPAKGRISGSVRVFTDHPEKKELLLRFFGFFAEPLER